jgi:chaperone required for assembly of F1-ATPase
MAGGTGAGFDVTESKGGEPKTPAAGRARFYKTVGVDADAGMFRLVLDGKPVRTPAKKHLVLPVRALADAVAAEWESQKVRIDPVTMPLTRLANSAIDGVTGREAEVRADIARYAGSDLICYRAEAPPELVRSQAQAWEPVLAWARDALGASFHVAQGIMPVSQPVLAVASVARAIEVHGAFELAALHVITTLTGSALLALAHAGGQLTAHEAWAAAHVDEDWQISQWGEDAEAKARREARWLEMQAASRLIQLLA